MLNIYADACLHWGKRTKGFSVQFHLQFVQSQASQRFTTSLISLPLHCSHVLTIYGDVLLLCYSFKKDVPALKWVFIARWPSPETLWVNDDLPGQGEAHTAHSHLSWGLRILAGYRKNILQLNRLWRLTKQKQSVWEPERLMWVNTTCRAGRSEGQAGCDWQSDKLLDVGLHLSPLISHISNSFSTGLIFYFTSGHCKLTSAFDSFSTFYTFLACATWLQTEATLSMVRCPVFILFLQSEEQAENRNSETQLTNINVFCLLRPPPPHLPNPSTSIMVMPKHLNSFQAEAITFNNKAAPKTSSLVLSININNKM